MNIKKILTIAIILQISLLSYAANPNPDNKNNKKAQGTVLKMPTAVVLAQQLTKAGGFEYFMEKSKIHEKLGGQEKYALGVAMQVELSLADYTKTLSPVMGPLMAMRKPALLKALLTGFPHAIKELEDLGLIEKD